MFQIWSDKISTLRVRRVRRVRRFTLELIESIAPKENNWISKSALSLIKIRSSLSSRESRNLNFVLTRLLPADPLTKGTRYLPTLLLCAPKDLEILPYSLGSVVENLSGAEDVWILVPQVLKAEVREILAHLEIDARILTDEDLITNFLGEEKTLIEKDVRMQLLKLLAVLSLNNKEMLVVDGDTVFLKSRIWIFEEKIVFPVSQEHLPRYSNFNRRRLGLKARSGLGFVTHHQVVCKKCVQDIVSKMGGISILAECMQSAFMNKKSWKDEYPSEWQFLGDFLLENIDHELLPARFANIGLDRNSIRLKIGKGSTNAEIVSELKELSKSASEIYSISLHSYK